MDETKAVIIRDEHGRFLPGTKPPNPITSVNARSLALKRQEKAAAALRKKIFDTTQAKSTIKLTGPAEAVAEAGAILWDEVVLAEPEAGVYPRDRLEAWEKLGKHAGILGDTKQQPLVQAESITLNVLVADAMRDALALYRAGQAEQADDE